MRLKRSSRSRSATRQTVLIVEDDPARCAVFREMFSAAARLDIVATYEGAVEALSRRRYSLVLLDHDIASADRNGQDVALWLAQKLPRRRRPKAVIVHSANKAGAFGIHETLKAAGVNVRLDPFPPSTCSATTAMSDQRHDADRHRSDPRPRQQS